jgi:hypothetical protein
VLQITNEEVADRADVIHRQPVRMNGKFIVAPEQLPSKKQEGRLFFCSLLSSND